MARNFPMARATMRARLKQAEASFLTKGAKATGRLTATQSGARRVALMRDDLRTAEGIMNAVSDTSNFEDQIRGKKKY
jgi:hypothetical protein